MDGTELDATDFNAHQQTSTQRRPLSEFERALFDALTDDAVCTSVLYARARLLKGMTPTTTLGRELVVVACEELVQRGLAERQDAPNTIYWRRPRVEQREA